MSAALIDNATSLPASVSLGFNNVASGNNAWVVVTVAGFDSQNGAGSSVALGELAGLFNVGSSATVTLTAAGTERFQLALAAMSYGLISTYDLANEASLDSDLSSFVSQSGASADPATGLYDSTTLTGLIANLVSRYSRTITVSGSYAEPSTVYLTWDYTNKSELDFAANVARTIASIEPVAIDASALPPPFPGSPSFGAIASQPTVPTNPAAPNPQANVVTAYGIDAVNGQMTSVVYGGAVKIAVATVDSASQTDSTYSQNIAGGYGSEAGIAAGRSGSANVDVAGTLISETQTDATLYSENALATNPNLVTPPMVVSPAGSTAYDVICTATICHESSGDVIASENLNSGMNYTGSANLAISEFDPWGLPSTAMQICDSNSGECNPLSAGGSFTTHTPFFDCFCGYYQNLVVPATGAGATKSIKETAPTAYTVNYTGGLSGYVDYPTGTQSNGTQFTYDFDRGQQLVMTTTAPTGTVFYFDGCASTATGTVGSGGTAAFNLTGYSGLVSCTQGPSVGYTLPSGTPTAGSFEFGPIYANPGVNQSAWAP